jgi:hypothetical protein
MSEQRDYHLKRKDFIPLIGLWEYHRSVTNILSEKLFSKEHLYSFPREVLLTAINTIELGSAAAVGLIGYSIENLVK